MSDKIKLMKEYVELLNKANKAYYEDNNEIMSNLEYDKLYDELLDLEKEMNITLSNSPTVNVGYELLSSLPKEPHEKPMLSLDKTKDITTLKDWLNDKKGLLSWKLDGLTIVLTYEDGKLKKAVTRGNGEVGEVITNNAKVFKNLPLNISYKGSLILRGEAVITYSDFEKINEKIENVDAKYKNPRNLCSGSVRQLNNEITAKRDVNFYAFSLVKADDINFENSRKNQMEWLKKQGFAIVDYKEVNISNLEEIIEWFSKKVEENDIPSDGLVLTFDDISYGESLGSTSKFPRDSIAFKWRDELKETKLLKIEWSASRTGLINPIAIFEPVELEGTTVTRASVHNISILEDLELGIEDKITVYKANMIIPQIEDNLTRSNNIVIPSKCPVCNHDTEIKNENEIKTLYCTNDECLAKQIKKFTHFISRDAMNIDGMSEATIEKFIAKGFIKELADIFHIEKYKDSIITMEGFGERSYNNLIKAIDKSRKVPPFRFLYSLGISNVGLSNAKVICKRFSDNWEEIQNAKFEELVEINGIGDIMANKYTTFFQNEKNQKTIQDILCEIELEKQIYEKSDQIFENMNFVITGSVELFKNRDELKEFIESKGGKVTGSVTSKTNYLINNDNLSSSSKNKKAKELGVKIITEEEFKSLIN